VSGSLRRRVVQAVLVALAVWSAWPRAPVGGETFALPTGVKLRFPGGGGPAGDLVSGDGRIGARSDLSLAFRDVEEPVHITTTEPRGPVVLRLGQAIGGRLSVDDDRLALSLSDSASPGATWPRGDGERFDLVWTGERYRALTDGEVLQPEIEGPPPDEEASVALAPNASVRTARCRSADGYVREVVGVRDASGLERVVWAALAALLVLECLRAWRATRARVEQEATPQLLPRRMAALASLALAVTGVGFVTTLRVNNAERLLRQPPACDQMPIGHDGPLVLRRGAPLELTERRDGDYRLAAIVALGERSVVDVKLRGSSAGADRQVLLTLSSDPDLPGGLALNNGRTMRGSKSQGALSVLTPGRHYRLEVEARGEQVRARLDGSSYGSVRDYDLRVGTTAWHAIAGEAVLTDLSVEPLGQPQALPGTLWRWMATAALGLLAAAWIGARFSGLGPAGLLWLAPLAAVAAPFAPGTWHTPGWWLAVLLLLLTPMRGRRLIPFAAGAAVLGLALWVEGERPRTVTAADLNALDVSSIHGAPIPERHAWARHPLCRRFNYFVNDQTFRNERVAWDKPAGVTRIVALGGSSTLGHGVAEAQAWPKQVEALLRAGGRASVQVVNAGVSAATAEMLRLDLQGVLLDLAPDVVVVSLGFNDHLVGGVADQREHFATMTAEGIGWFEGRKRAVSAALARRGWRDYVRRRAEREDVGSEEAMRFEFDPAERFGDSLRDMATACRDAGAAVLFVAEPIRTGERRPVLETYHAAMISVATERGLPHVAPQAALDATGEALFMDVVHPNARGQELLARLIADSLARDVLGSR
jgi:lysophospholipase L1-like esterase